MDKFYIRFTNLNNVSKELRWSSEINQNSQTQDTKKTTRVIIHVLCSLQSTQWKKPQINEIIDKS